MNSVELFKKLLGLEEPWYIKEIRFDHDDTRVDIWIDFQKGSRFKCPLCGKLYGVHETDERTWGHLNIFQNPPMCMHGTQDKMQRTWKENS